MLVNAVTLVENDDRRPFVFGFRFGKSTHGADAAAVFDHRWRNPIRLRRSHLFLPGMFKSLLVALKRRQAYPSAASGVKESETACLASNHAYIHAHEFKRGIECGRAFNHDRAKNRPASHGGTPLRLLSGPVLRVFKQSAREALVPEHA